MTSPTQAELHTLFEYQGGHFFRKVSTSNRNKIGDKVGSLDGKGYFRILLGGRVLLLHRLIWLYHFGFMPPETLDHINRDKTDNRISNLRLATRSQNQMNKPRAATNKTGYKNISIRKGVFVVRIKVARKEVVRKALPSLLEAIAYRNKMLPIYHGEFVPEDIVSTALENI